MHVCVRVDVGGVGGMCVCGCAWGYGFVCVCVCVHALDYLV